MGLSLSRAHCIYWLIFAIFKHIQPGFRTVILTRMRWIMQHSPSAVYASQPVPLQVELICGIGPECGRSSESTLQRMQEDMTPIQTWWRKLDWCEKCIIPHTCTRQYNSYEVCFYSSCAIIASAVRLRSSALGDATSDTGLVPGMNRRVITASTDTLEEDPRTL